MHKNGKWARDIIALQDDEGKWGWFHSLSQFYDSPITTEQALRRLERLGYSLEDQCIQKAVAYMDDCLTGIKTIPDRREKLHDWDIFSSLILSAWIRRFTKNNTNANAVAKQWAKIVSCAFASGSYDHVAYIAAFQDIWGIKPRGSRFIDFVSFYPVSMLVDCLDEKTEIAFVDYILNKDDGIYYIYDKKILSLPVSFTGRETSRYLGAIELLAEYQSARKKLHFVVDWLNSNRNDHGCWDLGKTVNDKVYFPLSDDWRKKGARELDCTERIEALINKLTT